MGKLGDVVPQYPVLLLMGYLWIRHILCRHVFIAPIRLCDIDKSLVSIPIYIGFSKAACSQSSANVRGFWMQFFPTSCVVLFNNSFLVCLDFCFLHL